LICGGEDIFPYKRCFSLRCPGGRLKKISDDNPKGGGMADRDKMSSRELGLLLTEILMGAEDLHYGYWEEDLPLSAANIAMAQQRYSDKLIAALPSLVDDDGLRVLDIGCGVGNMMAQMLDRGYHVDGVSPSDGLSLRTRERLSSYPGDRTRLFECGFQNFPREHCRNQYDVALFSESFQYIKMEASFNKLQGLLKPGGMVIISDFFKTPADGDGGLGDGSFRGGHYLEKFYALLKGLPFTVMEDQDITPNMSPNLELVNDVLMNKVKPAGLVLGKYIRSNYPKVVSLYKLARPFFRKTEDKILFKYFSGYRSREVFERYKSYRFIRLVYTPWV
jgi:SAM-dependent methyltransferase